MPPETPATETPAAPAANEPDKSAPAAPAPDGGDKKETSAAPAAPNPEVTAAAQNWNAVKGLFREREDGALELNPEALPPERTTARRTSDTEDPDALAAEQAEARRQAALDHQVSTRTSAMGDKIAKDLQLQQRLELELKDEPGSDLIIAHAKAVMDAVPVERRSEKAWRNAIAFGRGATESKRREHWINEGRRKGEEDLIKVHGLRIPKPAPAPKTEQELVADLSPAQLDAARKMGLTPQEYAKSAAEMPRGGKR